MAPLQIGVLYSFAAAIILAIAFGFARASGVPLEEVFQYETE